MPSTASRRVLIDQSLTGFAGHHYEYDLAVLRATSALRLGVSLAVHHDFSEGSLAGAPVVGRFAAGWNEAHHRGWVRRARRALGQMPSWLRLPLLRMAKWVPRDKVLPAKAGMPASPFGTTLAAIIGEQKLTEHDHLLVHTLSGGEFAALVTALARQASLPHIQLVFRYDIEENASAQSDFKIGLKTMTSDALLLRCCHFYSDTGAARRALPPARCGQCHSAAYPALPPATAGAKGEGRPAYARLSRWGARRQGL
jgi:hypothetical protein